MNPVISAIDKFCSAETTAKRASHYAKTARCKKAVRFGKKTIAGAIWHLSDASVAPVFFGHKTYLVIIDFITIFVFIVY